MKQFFLYLFILISITTQAQFWKGTYNSKYGTLKIVEEYGTEYPNGGMIYGDYGTKGTLSGTLQEQGKVFSGTFFNGADTGKFYISKYSINDVNFSGGYGYGNTDNRYTQDASWQWTGNRTNLALPSDLQVAVWSGKWNTNDGYVILNQVGNKVTGIYKGVGTVEGIYNPATRNLTGTFYNNSLKKQGYFQFLLEGNNFKGKWGWTSAMTESAWNGEKHLKTNKAIAATNNSGSTTPSPTHQTNNGKKIKFRVRAHTLGSAGDIYGFIGFQLYRVDNGNKTEIKSIGNKSPYLVNTNENNLITVAMEYKFPYSPAYYRDFEISEAEFKSTEIDFEIKAFTHLKEKITGPNSDFGYTYETFSLKDWQKEKLFKVRSKTDKVWVELDIEITKIQ